MLTAMWSTLRCLVLLSKGKNGLGLVLDDETGLVIGGAAIFVNLGLYLLARVVVVEARRGHFGGALVLLVCLPDLVLTVNRVFRQPEVLLESHAPVLVVSGLVCLIIRVVTVLVGGFPVPAPE